MAEKTIGELRAEGKSFEEIAETARERYAEERIDYPMRPPEVVTKREVYRWPAGYPERRERVVYTPEGKPIKYIDIKKDVSTWVKELEGYGEILEGRKGRIEKVEKDLELLRKREAYGAHRKLYDTYTKEVEKYNKQVAIYSTKHDEYTKQIREKEKMVGKTLVPPRTRGKLETAKTIYTTIMKEEATKAARMAKAVWPATQLAQYAPDIIGEEIPGFMRVGKKYRWFKETEEKLRSRTEAIRLLEAGERVTEEQRRLARTEPKTLIQAGLTQAKKMGDPVIKVGKKTYTLEQAKALGILAALRFTEAGAVAAIAGPVLKPITKIPIVGKVLAKPAVSKWLGRGLGTAYVASESVSGYKMGDPIGMGVELAIVGGLGTAAGLYSATKLLELGSVRDILSTEIKKLSPAKKTKFLNYMKEVKSLEKAGHLPVKKVSFEGVDRLPKVGRNPTKTFLKKYGDILGGSQGARTMTYGKPRSYATSDIDVYTKGDLIKRAKDLAKLYTSVGIKRVSVVPGTGRVTIAGNKVAEFHSVKDLYANIRSVTPAWRPISKSIVKSPDGVKVAPVLAAQARRKLIGAFLEGRYGKDMVDFKKITQTMVAHAEKVGREPLRVEPKEFKEMMKVIEPKPFFPKVKKIPTMRKPIPPYKPYVPYRPYILPIKVTPYPYKEPKPFIAPYKPLKPYKPIPYKPVVPYKPIKPSKPIPAKAPKPSIVKPYKAKEIIPVPYKLREPIHPIAPYKPLKPYKPVIYKPREPIVPFKRITPPPPPPHIPKRFIPAVIPKKPKPLKSVGFIAEVRRRKKWKPITPVVKRRGVAVFLGARVARETLAAAVRVRKVRGIPRRVRVPELMRPSKKVFRAYRIKKGKKIALKDTWIQRKQFRLAHPKEVYEIHRAKRVTSFFKPKKKVKKKIRQGRKKKR